MKSLLPALLLTLAPALLPAQGASVTLFSNGQVLVRQSWPLSIPAGKSLQLLPTSLFDPATLVSLDPGVSFNRLDYRSAPSEDNLLQRSIGQRVEYIIRGNPDSTSSAVLLGLNPERWRIATPNGDRVVYTRPGLLRWAVDQSAGASARIEVTSEQARSEVPVLYQTGGSSWSAQYQLFVGKAARFEGVAQITTGSLDLTDVEVQLLAGDIGARVNRNAPMMRASELMAQASPPSEEAVGNAHLYTLPGRIDLMPDSRIVVPLFPPATVLAERHYTVRGSLFAYGGMVPQDPTLQQVPVEVTWRVDRPFTTPFGKIPLPRGAVNIFAPDQGGRMQLIGLGRIGHLAAGEPLIVSAGYAFDLTARRTQTEYQVERSAQNRSVATIAYQVEVGNAGDSTAVVEVLEERNGEWTLLDSSVAAARLSSGVTSFPLTVPPHGKATLTYRVRVLW